MMGPRVRARKGEPTPRTALTTLLLAILITASAAALAQEAEEPTATPAPTPTPVPTPIPATEIPDRAAEIVPVLREAVARTDVGEEVETIAREFEKEKEHLVELLEETRRRLDAAGPASVIEEAQISWLRSASRLDGWLNILKQDSTAIAEEVQKLRERRELWELTGQSAEEVELPDALRDQVAETLEAIDAAEFAVRANRDTVLTLQSDVAREKANVDEMLALQKEEIARRRRSIVGIDSPPLWKSFALPGIEGGPTKQLVSMWTSSSRSIEIYVADRHDRLLRQAVFFVVLVMSLVFLHRRGRLWAGQDRSLEPTVDLLDRPFAAAFIVTMLLGEIFHPRAPAAWIDLMGLGLLLALLRLLPRIVAPSMRSAGYLLALIYLVDKISSVAPEGDLVNRLALVALSVISAASMYWFMRKIRGGETHLAGGWKSVVLFAARVGFVALVISAFLNVIGALGLAQLITRGTLSGIYAAVLFWVAAVLLRAMVRVALLTDTARRLAIVRLHGDTVRSNLFRVIQLVTLAGWAIFTLEGFGALDSVVDGLISAFESKIAIGDFSFSPGDILIFVVVVWLTFRFSQLLSFVLEADVLPHMDLPRGVPGAITRLSHYAIVVLGVMIAATAAGLDFSRINLIVGALGVGIGFGLQNVVNNFVSGLILLFERPIRVGDKIQLAELFGTVRNIGMRASVVRTFQGAEVIVPNANLISAEVVNWTLSDERRRMELPVGVAYGTDPQTVIDLLQTAADQHPDVLDDPAPEALFLGFGASSLDFQLRAWTRTDFVRVSSELRVAMHAAIRAAGIEIPFPQRDLHLRSVAKVAAETLSGRSERDTD